MNVEGGWYRYTTKPMSAGELERRQAESAAFLTLLDQEIDRARISRFGQVKVPTTESARMPLSNHLFEWRTDGFYRVTEPEGPGAEPGDGVGDWTPWNPDDGVDGTREVSTGAATGEPWHLHYGCTDPDAAVTVHRQDSVAVPVVRLGGLWIAEWRGPAQPVTAAVGDKVISI